MLLGPEVHGELTGGRDALVVSAGGKRSVLRAGSCVGAAGGRVSRIERDRIVLVEHGDAAERVVELDRDR